ncbi:MAG: hypothetical protein V4450_09930 [Bacteroidota bacterium]
MIIKNPDISYIGTQYIQLRVPLTRQNWEDITTHQLFNFTKDLFETDLPDPPYHEILFNIIGPLEPYRSQIAAKQDLTLKHTEWIIFDCTINGVIYPSFFAGLDWNNPASSLTTESIIRFISRKTAGNYAGELVSAPALESALTKMISGLKNGVPDQTSSVANIAAELMKGMHIADSGPALSVKDQVEEYLRSQDIPIDFSENAFYFHVDYAQAGWSVEITLSQEENTITAYSSIPLSEEKNGLHHLLEVLNQFNLTIGYGSYEYSQALQKLYFKNAVPVIGNRVMPELMNELMGHNFKQMAGIAAVIDKIGPRS